MGFNRTIDWANALDSGPSWTSFVYKTGSPVISTAGYWADLSMAAGVPKYNAWVGTQWEGTPLTGVGNFGIYNGGNVSPSTKHVSRLTVQTPSATFAPATFLLCDYVYFYPLIDMDSTDLQVMDNAQAALPRYTDGVGLRLVAISTVPQSTSAVTTVVYTDTTNTQRTVTFASMTSNIGNLICGAKNVGAANAQTPFLPMFSGTTGVKNVISVQNAGPAGGFMTLCLVKPLAHIALYETQTFNEVEFPRERQSAPRVYDGAYLNFFFQSGVAAVSSVVRATVDFAWG